MPAIYRDALQADHPGQPGLDRKEIQENTYT